MPQRDERGRFLPADATTTTTATVTDGGSLLGPLEVAAELADLAEDVRRTRSILGAGPAIDEHFARLQARLQDLSRRLAAQE